MKINDNNVYNPSGEPVKVTDKNAAMSWLSMTYPKDGNTDSEDPNYKDTNIIEFLFDVRMPQIIYYMGDYPEYPENERKNFKNDLLRKFGIKQKIKDVCFPDGEGDLVASYESCEAIKEWCENTQKLIVGRCFDLLKEKAPNLDEEKLKGRPDKESIIMNYFKEMKLSDFPKFEKRNIELSRLAKSTK